MKWQYSFISQCDIFHLAICRYNSSSKVYFQEAVVCNWMYVLLWERSISIGRLKLKRTEKFCFLFRVTLLRACYKQSVVLCRRLCRLTVTVLYVFVCSIDHHIISIVRLYLYCQVVKKYPKNILSNKEPFFYWKKKFY